MMITNEQMRRLEALERAARLERFEATIEEQIARMRPQAEEIAEVLGCTADALIADTVAISRRIEEIGEEAWEAEEAAARGLTVDELRRQHRDFDLAAAREQRRAWQEELRRRRTESDVIVWHGGKPPIPYRNGEIVRDEHGEPLKFS